jgi:hypothetical protein
MQRVAGAVLVVAAALAGCGASARPAQSVTVVTVARPAARPRATTVPPPADPKVTLVLAFRQKVPGAVRGVALERGRLYVNVAGALRVFDAHGPVARAPSSWKRGDPLVVVGDAAFDPVGLAPHAPAAPAGLSCDGRAFSWDASRMSVDCQGKTGDAVYVYDTRTGAEVGVYKEFQTAAPVRSGAITASGNFVFWVSRATGAFEEIKSHVTGPPMSSHSVMSRDESMVFTTVDRTWYTDDTSPARVIDPKNGRTLFSLGRDVDTVFFSPSSRLLAARHSANWADLAHAAQHDRTSLTIHARSADVVARVPGDDAVEAAFSPDDAAVAVRAADGVVSVYEIRR